MEFSRSAVALLLLSVLSACPAPGGSADAGPSFVHEKVAVRCKSSVSVSRMRPLGPGDVYLANLDELGAEQRGDVGGLISRDYGTTFSRVPGEYDFDGEPHKSSLAYGERPFIDDENFFAVFEGLFGSSNAQQGGADKNPLYLTVVLNGLAREIRGITGLTLQSGLKTDLVWKASPTHWMARAKGWMYSTRDGGKTVKKLSPLYFLLEGDFRLELRDSKGDIAFYRDDQSRVIRRDAFGALQVFTSHTQALGGSDTEYQFAGFWGERPVVSRFGPVHVLDGDTWKKLERDESIKGHVRVKTDPSGNLWTFNEDDGVKPEDFKVYRYADGTTRPVQIDFEFGSARVHSLRAVHFLADGRMRFIARQDFSRDFRSQMICEAGPGVTTQIDRVVVEPIQNALSGRMIIVGRLSDRSGSFDRFAVSPSGRIYGTRDALLAHPLDATPLYEIPTGVEPAKVDGGIVPYALFDATDATVSAVLHTNSNLLAPPPNLKVTFDALTGKRLVDQRLGKDTELLRVDEAGPLRFARFEGSTYLLDFLSPRGPNLELPPKFAKNLVISPKGEGAILSFLEQKYQSTDARQGYLYRFSATSNPVPDEDVCHPPLEADGGQGPVPSQCEPIESMAPVAAAFGADGVLFVLDQRQGRVVAIRPGEVPIVQDVARGFASASDMRVVTVGGTPVVLVLDGDVFAFTFDDRKVRVRGADPSAPPVGSVAVGSRDLRDCLADGPCLTAPSYAFTAEGCVTGERFGSAKGALLAGSVNATVTSWADGKVCGTGTFNDGLVQLVRADGVPSNLVPFTAPAEITTWPAPGIAGQALRATGKNLASVTLAGAELISASDAELLFRMTTAGSTMVNATRNGSVIATHLVTTKPDLQLTCHADRAQGCVIFGVGFGLGGTTQLAAAGFTGTVGGQSVALKSWQHSYVAFDWPAGLAPGTHALELKHPAGWSIEGMVELLEGSPRVISHDSPVPAALTFAHPRPLQTTQGLLASLTQWPQGANVGGVITPGVPEPIVADLERIAFVPSSPMEVALPVTTSLQESRGAFPMHVRERNNTLFAVASDPAQVNRTNFYRLDPKTGTEKGWTHPIVGRMSLPIAAGEVTTVAAINDSMISVASSSRTFVAPLAFDADGGVRSGPPVDVGPALMWRPQRAAPAALGAFLVDGGVYVTSCHNEVAPAAKLSFVPLTTEADGGLAKGTAVSVVDGAASRIITCASSNDGFLWVERAAGQDRVFTHAPGEMTATLLVTLPATLPGVGQEQTYSSNERVPGVLDLARLPDGDLLVLLNEQQKVPRGLRVARWDLQTGAWTQSQVQAPSGLLSPGERCIGPLTSAERCEGWAKDGCAPFSCSVTPPELSAVAQRQIGEAFLTVRGTDALVLYETVNPFRRGTRYGGTDVLFVKVPIP